MVGECFRYAKFTKNIIVCDMFLPQKAFFSKKNIIFAVDKNRFLSDNC